MVVQMFIYKIQSCRKRVTGTCSFVTLSVSYQLCALMLPTQSWSLLYSWYPTQIYITAILLVSYSDILLVSYSDILLVSYSDIPGMQRSTSSLNKLVLVQGS